MGGSYLQVNTAKHQTPRTSRRPLDEILNGQVLAVPAGGDLSEGRHLSVLAGEAVHDGYETQAQPDQQEGSDEPLDDASLFS